MAAEFYKIFKFIIALCLFTIVIQAQQKKADSEVLKNTALSHMQAGRYGEAIDQLNKYISQNPQISDGYNYRAICFEKRSQFEYARLDYRRAIAIENRDANKRAEYEKNLSRLISIWYPILEKKINGHLREIAIDPNNAYNYLEIGKSYKLMEIWDKAEQWYDEYLKRDDNASPDEIIRYTEILAKTKNIVKGERILKKYVERFPEDWRLWSRYGYFTLWLSKFAIAKKAFETSLGFKPFFKEAQDGLDIVNREAYLTQQDPRAFEKEYDIDRYYRMIRRSPGDIETRFKLVDELLKVERFEEAFQQLQFIGLNNQNDERYIEKMNYVTEYRLKNYEEKILAAKQALLINPDDKESIKTIAQNYENLQYYDSAAVMLSQYFEKFPDEKDQLLRFRFARVLAWNREFDRAIDITDGLLKEYPNNLDYQLFRAQVSVWINRDLTLARQYLENVLKEKPNDLQAIISFASLKLLDQDFEEAQALANRAKEIDPNNDDVIKLQSNIDWQILRAEEEKLYAILETGRQRVVAEDCPGALPFYEEYLSKAEPNVLITKEYGDVLFCAKDYQRALQAYNEVLEQGENFDAQMNRGKLYFAMGDSVNAAKEFKELVEKDSANFEANLYLADSYAKLGENGDARDIYNDLLEWESLDSVQTEMVKLRKGWLPITGLAAILETFPSYVGLAPIVSHYSDNTSFRLTNYGSRLELGVTSYLTLGISFMKQHVKANGESLDQELLEEFAFTGSKQFTTFKGHILLRPSKIFSLGAGFGSSIARGILRREEKDAFMRMEKADTFSVGLTYQYSDAALILYSPYLIDNRLYASLFKADGYFVHENGFKISGYFQYVSVEDGNESNDLMLRLGRYITKDFIVGYEYAYSNSKLKADYYYSPTNFESHSIWVDQDLDRKKDLRVLIGGKIGIVPQNKFLALEGHFELFHQLFPTFSLSARLAMGTTSRDQSSYRYFSGQISAYWTVL